MTVTVLNGDCLTTLPTLPSETAQTCVTSPPYFGLRDYGHAEQIGLEESPEAYIARLVDVFREVRRVLAKDGTLWLNLGDSYARTGGTDRKVSATATVGSTRNSMTQMTDRTSSAATMGAKEKDLLGIPWRVALALQSDGWFLRSDIIWSKPNPMPESVTDRPTKAHEYVFLLSKSARYFYEAGAISEASSGHTDMGRMNRNGRVDEGGEWPTQRQCEKNSRNARTVWTIATRPYKGAHFATMPPELARRCILAGSKEGDTILDPFGGAGTTGLVADRTKRNAVLCELNPEYAELARRRIFNDAPFFADVTPPPTEPKP